MAFDYEAAKAQYGVQRAREMEGEASGAPPPTPAAPAAPSASDSQKLTDQLTGGKQPAYNTSRNNKYQNYDNYQPPQNGYQTPANPTGASGSGAAQQHFNSQSAADQQAIRASWGGKDMMNEWYANAQKAGAVPAATAAGSPFEANRNIFNSRQDFKDTNIGQGQWDAWDAEERSKAGGVNANNSPNKYNQDGKGCPPNLPYTSRPGPDGKVECAAKPDDCPEGQHVEGTPGKCVPNGQGQQAPGQFAAGDANGGGGQGGAGGAGGYGGGAGTNQSDLALYQVKQQYADALNDPTGQKAWQLYAGQGGQKSFQTEMDRYRQSIAGMPAGPARSAAEQKMNEVESSMRLDMPQQARTQALAGLQGVIQPELGYVGSERDRALNKLLGEGNLSNQRYGMNLNYNLGSRGLDLQGQNQMWNQNTYFPWQAGNEAARLGDNRYQFDRTQQGQYAQQTGAATGQMLQQAGSYFMSDIRMKENIVPGRRGLSDLLKLRSYSYNYKDKPEKTQSIMAQDVEKVAPELVKVFDGIKMVDSYGLLGMTMKAVQDLAKKMEKK